MKLFKTELHTHSSPASSCADFEPRKVVELYKETGYDSLVLTNHFALGKLKGETTEDMINWYLEDYYKAGEEGGKLGLNIILGAELRFSENMNDYLIFGICPDDLFDIYNLLPYGIDNFYKEYKNDKNIIIQAHPFRDGMKEVNPESIDGIEVFNMHPGQNSKIGFAAKYACEKGMIITSGSDFHHEGHNSLCAILTKKELKDSYDVAKVLKQGKYKISISDLVIDI